MTKIIITSYGFIVTTLNPYLHNGGQPTNPRRWARVGTTLRKCVLFFSTKKVLFVMNLLHIFRIFGKVTTKFFTTIIYPFVQRNLSNNF